MTNQIFPRQLIPYLKEMLGYRYWSSKWHRHYPTACTGAISLCMQGWNTKCVLHCVLVFFFFPSNMCTHPGQNIISTDMMWPMHRLTISIEKLIFLVSFHKCIQVFLYVQTSTTVKGKVTPLCSKVICVWLFLSSWYLRCETQRKVTSVR